MKNRATVVRFPVFGNYEVRVIQARDVKKTGQRLHAQLDPGTTAAWVSSVTNPMVAYLVFGPDADAGTIGHEASHAVRALFQAVGVRNDEESFAYHLGHLEARIHKFLKGRH